MVAWLLLHKKDNLVLTCCTVFLCSLLSHLRIQLPRLVYLTGSRSHDQNLACSNVAASLPLDRICKMGDFCGDNCTGTPLTTVFTPPASCTDNWTPVGSPYVEGGIQVTLTRNVIDPACVPTQWIPGCDVCYPGLSNISPGLCPEGAQAARTGISTGVTTYYCCPL